MRLLMLVAAFALFVLAALLVLAALVSVPI
jgi:hypothetical protein